MHVCMCSVAQACPTLCDPMDCSPPGSSRHEILQARLLEWGAMPSRGSSQPKDITRVCCAAGGFFTAELPGKPPEWQHTPSSPKPEPPTAWWYVLKLPSDQPYLILFHSSNRPSTFHQANPNWVRQRRDCVSSRPRQTERTKKAGSTKSRKNHRGSAAPCGKLTSVSFLLQDKP